MLYISPMCQSCGNHVVTMRSPCTTCQPCDNNVTTMGKPLRNYWAAMVITWQPRGNHMATMATQLLPLDKHVTNMWQLDYHVETLWQHGNYLAFIWEPCGKYVLTTCQAHDKLVAIIAIISQQFVNHVSAMATTLRTINNHVTTAWQSINNHMATM